MPTIGSRIRTRREELGLSQDELAKRLGYKSRSSLNKIELDQRNLTQSKIKAIADALETTPSYIMGWDETTDNLLLKTAREKVNGDRFFEKTLNEQETLLSLSNEAMKIAKDYSDLDSWGKSAVRDLVRTEKQRCEDEDRFINDTQFGNFEPKVINRYLEPSAAGIAAPVEGKDFEPYELGPDDPQGAAYAIRVQGDSMEPDFPDGSTVFVNHDAIVNGDIGVFCVDGGTVIKQYYRDPFGMTYLFSLNRKRADADVPIYPSSGQTVICQGRVITPKRYPLPRLGEQ